MRKMALPLLRGYVLSFLSWLATRKTVCPDSLYWFAFILVVLAAAAVRAFWIYVLVIPYVQPDTPSYVSPVIENWLLPFSQFRTGGASMFVSAALLLFGHPIGILIVNGVLAVGSSTLLALSIKTVLRQNTLSLFALFCTAFTAKNITIEYFLMSEHYSRTLYVVYAALVLWIGQKPKRRWLVILVGLSVALNILVKPSAVVLVVATLIACAAMVLFSGFDRKTIAAGAAVFVIAVFLPILAYMSAFQTRYGTFSMTQYDGVNQFSHVGHLVVLHGGKHHELKARLKALIGPYAAKYASVGKYRPNWLIYGSADDELRRDFGDRSPARTIREYVRERYPSDDMRWMNEVYGDLATEAMLAHPVDYVIYAFERGFALWYEGYYFPYYTMMPHVSTLQRHRDDRALQRKWYYDMYGEPVPPCDAGESPPVRAIGVPARLYRGPIASCESLPYDDKAVVEAARAVDLTYAEMTSPLAAIFVKLPKLGAAAAVLGGLLLWVLGGRLIRNLYTYALLLMLVLLGYTMLHGLINVAETQRMTSNVQDYVIVASSALFLSALLSIQRILLVVMTRRRRLNLRHKLFIIPVGTSDGSS